MNFNEEVRNAIRKAVQSLNNNSIEESINYLSLVIGEISKEVKNVETNPVPEDLGVSKLVQKKLIRNTAVDNVTPAPEPSDAISIQALPRELIGAIFNCTKCTYIVKQLIKCGKLKMDEDLATYAVRKENIELIIFAETNKINIKPISSKYPLKPVKATELANRKREVEDFKQAIITLKDNEGRELIAQLNKIPGAATLKNVNGQTLLHRAVANDSITIEKIESLLKLKGININVEDEEGNTAFRIAFKNADEAKLNLLLNTGNIVDCIDVKWFNEYKFAEQMRLIETVPGIQLSQKFVNTALNYAISSNNIEEAEYLIQKKGAQINSCIGMILHLIQRLEVEKIQWLIDKGIDLNEQISYTDTFGHPVAGTPLQIAVNTFIPPGNQYEKLMQIIKLLIDKSNTDVIITAAGNQPLLLWVVTNNFTDLTKLILKSTTVDLKVTDENKNNALHIAIQKGNIDIIRQLLKSGVDFKSKNMLEETPLSLAVKQKNYEVVRELLQYGVEIDIDLSMLCNDIEMIKIFIEYGINLDQKIIDGKTFIEIAVESKNIEMIKLLIKSGANFDVKKLTEILKTSGKDLDKAENTRRDKEIKEIIELPEKLLFENLENLINNIQTSGILAKHKDIVQNIKQSLESDKKNIPNKNKKPDEYNAFISKLQASIKDLQSIYVAYSKQRKFISAIKEGNVANVEYFISLDSDLVNILLDEAGRTPLLLAAEKCQSGVVQILLENGANIFAKKTNGYTALHIIANLKISNSDKDFNNKSEFQKYIVSLLTTDLINIRDEKGNTPIMLAALIGNYHVVDLLKIQSNIDLTIKNNEGKTFNDMQSQFEQKDIEQREVISREIERSAQSVMEQTQRETPASAKPSDLGNILNRFSQTVRPQGVTPAGNKPPELNKTKRPIPQGGFDKEETSKKSAPNTEAQLQPRRETPEGGFGKDEISKKPAFNPTASKMTPLMRSLSPNLGASTLMPPVVVANHVAEQQRPELHQSVLQPPRPFMQTVKSAPQNPQLPPRPQAALAQSQMQQRAQPATQPRPQAVLAQSQMQQRVQPATQPRPQVVLAQSQMQQRAQPAIQQRTQQQTQPATQQRTQQQTQSATQTLPSTQTQQQNPTAFGTSTMRSSGPLTRSMLK